MSIDLDQLTQLLARGASRSPELHAEYHRHIVRLAMEGPGRMDGLREDPTGRPVLFLRTVR